MFWRAYPSKWQLLLLTVLIVVGLLAPTRALGQDTPSHSEIISTNQDRIVGGQDATPGEWPWQVHIIIGGSSLCGGSLVHPRWVVTAAHCVGNTVITYKLPSDFQVILGNYDRSVPEASEQVRNVVQVVVHPGWDSTTNDNDIALLKLDIPVTLNSTVSTVPLGTSPADDLLMQPGDLATVTGWGDTSEGGNTSAILQEVKVPIVSNLTCDAAMTDSITDNMLCAGFVEGGKDACQGDSGGPLVVPNGSGGWKLAGVVSFGTGCAQPGKYGVYARVSRYTEWIQSYINSPNGPNPVRNADFELGRNGDWNEFSTNSLDLVTNQSLPITPRSGSYVAWLGGDNNELSSIGQIVSLNERASGLTFYSQIQSSETECTFDIGTVVVNGSSQGSLPLCTATASSIWISDTINLSSFAGRTIIFGINVTTDELSPSSQYVDDVAIATFPLPSFNVEDFTPVSGKPGTTVTLNGGNFLDLTEVLFNGVTASFSVQSDSVLNVTVPTQASTGIITLKTAYSTTTSAQTFTVLQSLTVAKTGNGSGTVTSNLAGVSCGGDCSEDYSDSTEVTLTATPAANSTFTGWSGACSGSAADCNISMNAIRAVTATFTLKTFAVTVNKVGNGSITSSPDGINCGADCIESYTVDTNVTLTAQPASDSLFVGWTGACSGTTTDCIINVNEAKSATATFTPRPFSLSVSKIGNGSVASTPTGITCGVDCSESYTINTNVTLTAMPAADSTFSGWSGACSGNAADCVVSMSAARAVTATFSLKSFSMSVTKEGNGTITSNPSGILCGADCSQNYTVDTNVTLTAQPDADSLFLSWSGACSGNATDCVVSVNEDKSATATFSLKTFTLSVSTVGSGSVTSSPAGIACGVDCSVIYTIDTNVTLTAIPEPDFVFVGWSGACTDNNPNCTINIDSAKAVTATFAPKTFILSVTKSGNGNVSSAPSGIACGLDCEEVYDIATNVTLTAQPEDDSVFVGWGGACSGTNATCSVTVNSAKNVTATFVRKSFALNVTKGGNGKGTVTSGPSGIMCGEDCSEDYAIATSVTLTAQPEDGSSFSMWTGDCTGTQATCSVIINDTTNISAVFESNSSSLHLPLITP